MVRRKRGVKVVDITPRAKSRRHWKQIQFAVRLFGMFVSSLL